MRRYVERPTGMSDFVLDDMAHRKHVESTVIAEFERWGYRLLDTPLLEYADTVTKGALGGEEEQLYRLFDSSGRTLTLRPEMTTPVARIVASALSDQPLPLRLCYCAKTYREKGLRARDAAEVTQTGVELIGDGTPDADAEVIALMVSSLRKLGLQEFRLAVGHMGYMHAMLRSVPESHRDLLRSALVEKDLVAYELALQSVGQELDSETYAALLQAPRIRGGEEAIASAQTSALRAEARQACAELADLWAALAAHQVLEYIHLDLGLYLNHEYYTGVVIEGYADSLGQPICFGGRYDQLLGAFGRAMPATGCVLHVERLESIVPFVGEERPLVILAYNQDVRSHALQFASDLRSRGYLVTASKATEATDATDATDDGVPPQHTGSAARQIRYGTISGAKTPRLLGDSLLVEMFLQWLAKKTGGDALHVDDRAL